MNEAYLKSRLKKAIQRRSSALVYRHEDSFTAGIPDMSVNRDGGCVWVEVKYERPGRRSRPTAAQDQALRRIRGLLVTYGCDRGGVKTATVIECLPAEDVVLLHCAASQFPHDAVAAVVLNRLERQLAAVVSSQFVPDPPGLDLVAAVREFHQKFGVPVAAKPRQISEHEDPQALAWLVARRRGYHLAEEVRELELAVRHQSLEQYADALADLVYVAVGAALELGVPFAEVFAEVHRANMRKERVDDGTGHKLGIRKPEGWVPPDVAGVLRRAGA